MKNREQSKNILIRISFLFLGIISLVLGTIGIILPILPTVPFYLLASFSFMKSSKKLNDWFIKTKVYKKYVSGFVEFKSMSITGVLIMMILVSTMLIIAMLMAPSVLPMIIVLNILLICKYTYFIKYIKIVSKEELTEIKSKREVLI